MFLMNQKFVFDRNRTYIYFPPLDMIDSSCYICFHKKLVESLDGIKMYTIVADSKKD